MSAFRSGWAAFAALPLAAGCAQRTVRGNSASAGAVAGEGSSTSAGLTTSAANGSGGSAGSGGSTGSGGGDVGTTSGTTGGGTTVITDGGYVLCIDPNAPDGGPTEWLCVPGTYFCELGRSFGNCSQCRSDSDCTDQDLPTYDPARPRCDLDSGAVGYQGFCQQCLDDADCVGVAAGPLCDVYSGVVSAAALEPDGFEACGKFQGDCRAAGGPRCGVSQSCNPDSGECEGQPNICLSDQDCVGVFAYSHAYLPAPYCVTPDYPASPECGPCPGGACPSGACESATDCGNPSASPAGPSCDLGQCTCTESRQCSSFWPACVPLASGAVNDGGQAIGTCGCASNSDCADAGMVCVRPQQVGSYCGVPCTAPASPTCTGWESSHVPPDSDIVRGPVCDPVSGLCVNCTSDPQCQSGIETGGPTCVAGYCYCATDSDCEAGWKCELGSVIVPGSAPSCMPAPPHCAADSCFLEGDTFCDWDSGDCTSAFSCLADSDCAAPWSFCDPTLGHCVACRGNADCLRTGEAEAGKSRCLQGSCVGGCASPEDCIGNSLGSICRGDAGCGCASDAECAGQSWGSSCVTDSASAYYGDCLCTPDAGCPSGVTCLSLDPPWGFCRGPICEADSDCASQFFCDPNSTCRPRCDTGHACLGPDPACDTEDQAGLNGRTVAGSSPAVIWCVQCVSGGDCPTGEGCSSQICGECASDQDCAPGERCARNGSPSLCEASCDAGACPSGEVCDTLNLASNGTDVCYPCLTAADCPDDRGCNSGTHRCGSCENGWGPYGCFPGDVCSTYFAPDLAGVCLHNCDLQSCPASEPICGVLPALTTKYKYCFACLRDSDCTDAGPGAWCDVSVNRTYTCQPAPL